MRTISIATGALLMLAAGSATAQKAPSIPSVPLPPVVGSTAQVAIGQTHIGTAPTTQIGVGVLTPRSNTPQGSVATVTVPKLGR